MAVPNTTIEGHVWGDWEYESLQAALGLPMRADAIGRAASLWHWCLSKETDIAPVKVVEGKLGKGGAAALVDCGLGEIVEGGIRVRGAAKRVSEWQERQEGWSTGGAKAAAKAKKVGRTRGRFRKADDQVTSCPPAGDQLPPAGHQLAPAEHQPSASSSASDLQISHTPAREPEVTEQAPSSETSAKLLVDALWDAHQAARSDVAAKLGVSVMPLSWHDPGRRELAHRLREERSSGGSVVDAEERCRMAIARAAADCIRDGTVRWLEGRMWTLERFHTTASIPIEDKGPQRARPSGRPVEAPPRKIKRLSP
jgi:hypothetical protein